MAASKQTVQNNWNPTKYRLFPNNLPKSGNGIMGPGYFIIAILGCADSSAACTPVATMPTRYESQATCAAATHQALIANSDFDFPTLVAECRSVAPASAARSKPQPIPAGAVHG